MANKLPKVDNFVIKVDTTAQKLSDVISTINSEVDPNSDLTQLNEQAFEDYSQVVSQMYHKLRKLREQIDGAFSVLSTEQKRVASARQMSLFDFDTITIEDADGTTSTVKCETTTVETLDRSKIDSQTGLQVTKTVAGVDVYTRPSVRASKKKVKDAIANGDLTSDCLHVSTVQHFVLDFDDAPEDTSGTTQKLISFNKAESKYSDLFDKVCKGGK